MPDTLVTFENTPVADYAAADAVLQLVASLMQCRC